MSRNVVDTIRSHREPLEGECPDCGVSTLESRSVHIHAPCSCVTFTTEFGARPPYDCPKCDATLGPGELSHVGHVPVCTICAKRFDSTVRDD